MRKISHRNRTCSKQSSFVHLTIHTHTLETHMSHMPHFPYSLSAYSLKLSACGGLSYARTHFTVCVARSARSLRVCVVCSMCSYISWGESAPRAARHILHKYIHTQTSRKYGFSTSQSVHANVSLRVTCAYISRIVMWDVCSCSCVCVEYV